MIIPANIINVANKRKAFSNPKLLEIKPIIGGPIKKPPYPMDETVAIPILAETPFTLAASRNTIGTNTEQNNPLRNNITVHHTKSLIQ